MSERCRLNLQGCSPEPLMSYLKAIGILRLVSEQVDPQATGCWREGCFAVWSKLDEDALLHFFLYDYRPTPILGPWAGGSGFFGKDNRKAIEKILASGSERFKGYRRHILQVREILKREGITEKPAAEEKERLLRRYRREMPDDFVCWMDAAMVLQRQAQSFAPLLGTGGNDGRLDFTRNFMERLAALHLPSGKVSQKAAPLLRSALFDEATPGLLPAAVGQFAPGRAGGPNATQGMEGPSSDNMWDFVLMMEGALLLAGAAVRRLGVQSAGRTAFPFTVRARAVGENACSQDELGASRGEIWLPLWHRPATRRELQALFAEGRAETTGRPARNSVDFARAVADLGIDRGIRSFVRYGFLRRSGKSYLAPPLGRFPVPEGPRQRAQLLREIDSWLDAYRRACSGKGMPGRFSAALRRIEASIFDYCRYDRSDDIEALLIALGRAERELALTAGKRGSKEICRPLSRLSPGWLNAANDGSAEFRLALALAGIHDRNRDAARNLGSIRSNLEPYDEKSRSWAEKDRRVVWNSADLSDNLCAVLERRLMDGRRAGCRDLPLHSRWPVGLNGVAAFVHSEADDRRIDELLWGLILIDQRAEYPPSLPWQPLEAPPLPRPYALLKILFLPGQLVNQRQADGVVWRLARFGEEGVRIRPEPRVLPLLRSGRLGEACGLAMRRLRASGLKPLPHPSGAGGNRDKEWAEIGSIPDLDGRRLAASLLLPIASQSVQSLLRQVTREEREPEFAMA